MTEEVLYCTVGNHKWTRTAVRGRKPLACPEHRGVAAGEDPANPIKKKVLSPEARLEKARRVKAQRQVERAREARKDAIAEAKRLRKSAPELERRYAKALAKAMKAKTVEAVEHDFNVADTAMSAILNTEARIKRLEGAVNA